MSNIVPSPELQKQYDEQANKLYQEFLDTPDDQKVNVYAGMLAVLKSEVRRTCPPNIEKLLGYFSYAHLPLTLQPRSAMFGELAKAIVTEALTVPFDPDWAEVMVGLRNILIAKDSIVRAFLPPR